MTAEADLSCEGPRAVEEVPALLDRAEALLASAGCTAAARMRLTLVLEEVVVNILRNAWPDGAGQGRVFILSVWAVPEGEAVAVAIETEDDGVPFDPTAAGEVDIDAPPDDRPIGGLGLHSMRMMTGHQVYTHVAGRNRLRLEWRCSAAGADSGATQ